MLNSDPSCIMHTYIRTYIHTYIGGMAGVFLVRHTGLNDAMCSPTLSSSSSSSSVALRGKEGEGEWYFKPVPELKQRKEIGESVCRSGLPTHLPTYLWCGMTVCMYVCMYVYRAAAGGGEDEDRGGGGCTERILWGADYASLA